MNDPTRSPALVRALAEEGDELPRDFARRVARLAEAERAARWNWANLALSAVFMVMIAACGAGWSAYIPRGGAEHWLLPFAHELLRQPWLLIGLAGVGIVQGLTFGRRATSS